METCGEESGREVEMARQFSTLTGHHEATHALFKPLNDLKAVACMSFFQIFFHQINKPYAILKFESSSPDVYYLAIIVPALGALQDLFGDAQTWFIVIFVSIHTN